MRTALSLGALILASPLLGEKLRIQPFTTADGLANNHISRIRRDPIVARARTLNPDVRCWRGFDLIAVDFGGPRRKHSLTQAERTHNPGAKKGKFDVNYRRARHFR
jgi:hypothetical protein